MTATTHEWEISRHGHTLAILSDEDTMRRADVPALVAALRAVLELHRPVCVYAYAEDCGCGNEDHVIIEDEWGEDLCFDTPTGDVQCAYCRAEQSYVEHPCETVRAIEEALS